jgi:phage terminase large subunit
MYSQTTATRKILSLNKRIQCIAGGTSASKTISSILKLIQLSQTDTTPKLTSIVSETMPHLKKGAMRDFLNIMQVHNYYKDDAWNRSDFIYTFETGSKIEFFSADMPSKTRGPRRDRLYINEGNNVRWEAADQMMVRTRELIIIDWNPTNEFWAYTEVMPHRDHDFLTLTYKDNEALSKEIVEDIESHKNNKQWWRVYGEGQLGEVEGKVFKGWYTDLYAVPHEAKLEGRGLDFGYSNDPTALVNVYKYNGGFILEEVLYQKGLSNKQIADVILNLEDPQSTVYADSSEPKSIDEIRSFGVNIIAAQKGQGSVNQGIAFMQDQRISVPQQSTNLIKEYRNYMWETDKDGRILNKPIDMFNHCMDAIRYRMETYWRNSGSIAGIATVPEPVDVYVQSFMANEQHHRMSRAIAESLEDD